MNEGTWPTLDAPMDVTYYIKGAIPEANKDLSFNGTFSLNVPDTPSFDKKANFFFTI
jgi:hypothetical protein